MFKTMLAVVSHAQGWVYSEHRWSKFQKAKGTKVVILRLKQAPGIWKDLIYSGQVTNGEVNGNSHVKTRYVQWIKHENISKNLKWRCNDEYFIYICSGRCFVQWSSVVPDIWRQLNSEQDYGKLPRRHRDVTDSWAVSSPPRWGPKTLKSHRRRENNRVILKKRLHGLEFPIIKNTSQFFVRLCIIDKTDNKVLQE